LRLHIGQPAIAVQVYDEVIATSSDQILPSFNWFNSTFTIGGYFRSAQGLWLLGDRAEAKRRANYALELSVNRSDPFHRVITLFHVAMLYEFDRDNDSVMRLAGEMSEISSQYGYGFYRSSARLYIALAKLRRYGDSAELALIKEITRQQDEAGTRMFEPYWQANLAEAYILSGKPRQARRIARQALSRTKTTRNQYWDAGLWSVIGQSVQEEHGLCERSKDAFIGAIQCARQQGARELETRAFSLAQTALDEV